MWHAVLLLTCVRTSNTSLKVMLVDASLLCSSMTTLLLCSSTCFDPDAEAFRDLV